MSPGIRRAAGALLAAGLALGAVACSSGTDATTAGPSPTGAGTTGAGTTAAPSGSTPTDGASTDGASAGADVPARPSPGCSAPTGGPVAPGLTQATLDVGGVTREYRHHVGRAVDPATPAPLVVDIHGLSETRDIQAAASGWEPLSDTEGFVVLTPQGQGAMANWKSTLAPDNPDVAFLSQLLDATAARQCIDLARVYVGGISNGGMMSSIVTCELADRVAAVGLVSGMLVPDGCAPARPVPTMVFWGKDDVVLPFYGGLGPGLDVLFHPEKADAPITAPRAPVHDESGVAPVEETLAERVAANGCAPEPTVERVAEHVERRTFTGCTDGAEVVFYVIEDGGHSWPGSEAMAAISGGGGIARILGKTTFEVSATPLLWEFYQRHPLAP